MTKVAIVIISYIVNDLNVVLLTKLADRSQVTHWRVTGAD